MNLEIELTPRADTEIKEIFAYLGEQDLATAIDFYHAVFQSFERLTQFPYIGPARDTAIAVCAGCGCGLCQATKNT